MTKNAEEKNTIRYGGSTALFAAHTVDTVEEEQVHLGEIVSVKCFALILGVLYTFLVLILMRQKLRWC